MTVGRLVVEVEEEDVECWVEVVEVVLEEVVGSMM